MHISSGLTAIITAIISIITLVNAQTVTNRGVVQGTVTSVGTHEPLINANVVIEGSDYGASTDLDGHFIISNIPPGVHALKASMVGYKDQELNEVVIYEGMAANVNFQLEATTILLKETVVKGMADKGTEKRELEERMTSSIITDAVGGEAMKRMPDPNVANVVRRATGVSTDKGKPIIRGLGIRYSKITLNNSHISGTEPNRGGVSLDLFPASLMSQVTVNKSYLPDQFGEFGGGTINMNTWEFPGSAEFKYSTSTGYSSGTTFSNFQTYSGGNLDFLGFDDGARSLPDPIKSADSKITLKGRFTDVGYEADELELLGESFANNWNPETTTAAPDLNFSASYANSTKLSGYKFGYIVSGLYKNSYGTTTKERQILKGGENGSVQVQHYYSFQEYDRDVVLGGMAAGKLTISPLHSFGFNLLANRDVNDETRFFSGYNDDRQKYIQDTRLRFVAQNTLTGQVTGKHLFLPLHNSLLNWQLTLSRGERDEPDTRETQYEKDPDHKQYVLADESQSGSRIFNKLYDNSANANLDWMTPITDRIKLKTGYALLSRYRDSETRFFQFEPRSDHSVDISQNPEMIFNDDNININGFMVREATRPSDSYTAEHRLNAFYLMSDAQITEKVKIIGGVRYEHSYQNVSSYDLFNPNNVPVVGEITTGDFLPAVNVIHAFPNRMNLRFAMSQTVSRPDFREMARLEFTDIIGASSVIGNPDLKRAIVRNFDLRYEWAHGLADLFAVSFFYKYFENPIETVIQNTAQHRISYENAEGADNFGVELEVRQDLGVYSSRLEDWAVSSNLTLLESNIQLSDSTKGIQTSVRRPLHGQSPYLFNFNLQYTSPKHQTKADFFMHMFGKRISEIGSRPLPDIYEMPHPDLDLVISQPLGSRWSIKGAFKNILDSEIKFKQGDKYTERYREGVNYSIGLSYRN